MNPNPWRRTLTICEQIKNCEADCFYFYFLNLSYFFPPPWIFVLSHFVGLSELYSLWFGDTCCRKPGNYVWTRTGSSKLIPVFCVLFYEKRRKKKSDNKPNMNLETTVTGQICPRGGAVILHVAPLSRCERQQALRDLQQVFGLHVFTWLIINGQVKFELFFGEKMKTFKTFKNHPLGAL